MRNFFFLLLFFTSLTLKAQTPVIVPTKAIEREYPMYSAAGENDLGVYVLFSNDPTSPAFSVKGWNKDGEVFYTEYFKYELNESVEFQLESVFMFNNRPYAFYSLFDPGNKVFELFAQPLDQKTTALQLAQYPAYASGNKGRYRLDLSPNGKYMMVLHESPSDKNKPETMSVQMYSSIEEIIWSENVMLDRMSRPRPVNVPFVNNKGNVFLIKKDLDKTVYKFFIYELKKGISNPKGKTFTIPGKNISDIHGYINTNDQLTVTGFYSGSGYTNYEGVFSYFFGEGAELKSKNIFPLYSDILGLFMSKKAASKEGASLENFTIQYVKKDSLNNVYLICEQSTFLTEKDGEKCNYDDILILSLDPLGNIRWGRSIKKQQHTKNDNGKYSSFNLFQTGNEFYFVWNNISNGQIQWNSVELSGAQREGILTGITNNFTLIPEWILETGDQRYYGWMESKEGDQYGLMEFLLK